MVHKSRLLFAVAFTVVSCAASGCSSRKMLPLGEIPPPSRPDSTVQQATLSLIQNKAQANGQPVVADPAPKRRVQSIVDRLAHAAGAADFTYPVTVVNAGDDVNAMAVNGSAIVVFQELLKRVHSDDELATVLGHEIGHILGKHNEDHGAKDRAENVSVASSILGTVAAVGVAAAGGGSMGARAAGSLTRGTTAVVGAGAYVRSYNRDMEREADQIGIVLMARACFDPHAAITFWQRSDEILGATGGSFLSTHPSNEDRLKRLEAALPVAVKAREEAVCAAPRVEPPRGKRSAKKATKRSK